MNINGYVAKQFAAQAKTVIMEPEEENAASGAAPRACGFVWNGKVYCISWEKPAAKNR